MSLTLNFQGQIWNLLYLNQKRSVYHETKNKHIRMGGPSDIEQRGWEEVIHDHDFDHLVIKVT